MFLGQWNHVWQWGGEDVGRAGWVYGYAERCNFKNVQGGKNVDGLKKLKKKTNMGCVAVIYDFM